MRRQLVPALVSMVIFTVMLGLAYPLVVTGIAQVAMKGRADGSLVEQHGKDVGSRFLAQAFTDEDGKPLPQYFQLRPSAAGYDPTYSTGSNLGPTNPELLRSVRARAKAYRELNGLDAGVEIPVDAVTTSASGLDPDISIGNARLQAGRIAEERGLSTARVLRLIAENTKGRTLGIIGEKTVNVLELNLALDELS